MSKKYQANKIEVGDITGGNYSEFDPDGSFKMNGDATTYRDMLQSLIIQLKNNPSDNLIVNIAEGTLDYKNSSGLNDYAVCNIQINHDWKIGSTIYPHLHWFQKENKTPNWLVQYRWISNGVIKNEVWTDHPLLVNVFNYISGSTITQIIHDGGITPPEGTELSDFIQFRVIRDVSNASGLFSDADTYTGNAETINFDIHYEVDSIGSREQYTK